MTGTSRITRPRTHVSALAAKSQPANALPWDPAQPYRGLGFRSVEAEARAKFDHRISGREGDLT
jgi:hypothetical protein